MHIVKFDNVNFSYEKGINAVNSLSLEINKGEYVAVLGRNGSGKSTAAKLINGLLLPDSGKVFVDGIDTADKDRLFDIRKKVGMVFQNPDNQMVATIVEDDVVFGPENLGVEREEIGKRIEFALNATGTQKFRSRPASQLSGGQKQRVTIAGALALKPEILILDEATSMLDPLGRKEVTDVVKKLNKEQGMTVISVTHYMEEAVDADRIIVMKNGSVAFTGAPEQVFAREKELFDCGLCLPRATYIFNRLKEKGLLSGDIVLNDEQLEEKLCALFQNI